MNNLVMIAVLLLSSLTHAAAVSSKKMALSHSPTNINLAKLIAQIKQTHQEHRAQPRYLTATHHEKK